MPLAGFVPSELEYDYPRWTAPAIGSTDTGKAWAWNHATGKYEPATFLLASAVSVYGLTLASAADAAAARTALALGTAAVLNVGTSANQIVQLDGSARLPAVDGSQLTGISGGSVAGSNTQVIYNDAGAYGGDAGLTYAKATDRLTVTGGLVAPGMRPASNGTSALGWFDAAGTQWLYGDTTNRQLGIGVSPSFPLHVKGSSHTRIMIESPAATVAGFNLQSGPTFGSHSTWTIDSRGTYAGAINEIAITNQGTARRALTITPSAQIGIDGILDPTAVLDLAASTAARASLRVRAGTAPTTPNAGDIWYPTGGRLNVYRAATETIASGVPGTGGAATATGTWGATEQSMLQKCYDIVRAFGMLS